MKVTLEKDYRRFYTLEDLDHAKEVIAFQKADEMPVEEYAKIAVRAVANEVLVWYGDADILRAEAHTAKNADVWEQYGDTGTMDVWIDCIADIQPYNMLKVGAYLSDIWQITEDNKRTDRMYIRIYGAEAVHEAIR